MTDKLLPCPFCGQLPFLNTSVHYTDEDGSFCVQAECVQCDIYMSEDKWNTRADRPAGGVEPFAWTWTALGDRKFREGPEKPDFDRFDPGNTLQPLYLQALPPKVTRERTREEKIEKLAKWINWGPGVDPTLIGRTLALSKSSDATIDDLCAAAGIELTTTEES